MERAARTAWTLSDGHAGNVRQAVALATALDLADIEAITLAPRAPWRWLAPRMVPGSRHAFGGGFARSLASPPALAIGCGRQAALATRLLRAASSRVVQILDPRLDPKLWDVVVAPEHDGLAGENVVTLVGSLHPVDDAWLAQAREGFDLFAQLPAPRTTLLLGGPTAQSRYDDAALELDLASLAERMRAGGSVLVTTSRRTPDAWRAIVQRQLAGIPGVRWFGDGGEDNPYPGMLAWADRIACTPDSVNMISEACATRAPVLVLGMDGSSGRLRRFHASLQASGRVQGLEGAWPDGSVEPLRETARVAAIVRERLGLDVQHPNAGADGLAQPGHAVNTSM
jgi:hypothetical protein